MEALAATRIKVLKRQGYNLTSCGTFVVCISRPTSATPVLEQHVLGILQPVKKAGAFKTNIEP
jgi:hypothetical protein